MRNNKDFGITVGGTFLSPFSKGRLSFCLDGGTKELAVAPIGYAGINPNKGDDSLGRDPSAKIDGENINFVYTFVSKDGEWKYEGGDVCAFYTKGSKEGSHIPAGCEKRIIANLTKICNERFSDGVPSKCKVLSLTVTHKGALLSK